MKIYIIITCLICLVSCNSKNDIDARTYYDVESISKTYESKEIINIQIDTININSSIETSLIGDFWVFEKSLYFSDKYFNYIFKFNSNGVLTNRYVGKGNGPNEVIGFNYAIPTFNGFSLLFGGNNSVYPFDKNWNKVSGFRINWDIKTTRKEILENPDPAASGAYEFDYGIPGIFKTWDSEHVAIAITASHPKFNGYFDTSLYYNQSRILALVNQKTGKVDKLLGRRPPFYLSHANLPNFDHFNYEIISNDLFVNFWADPFIYTINKKSGLATGKFGRAGRGMKLNYPTTQTYEGAEEQRVENQTNFGYYHYLRYLPEGNLLLRGYTKGKGTTTDGLQIYKDFALVGDINVPKGLKIIGDIDGNIFGSQLELKDDDENLKIFKIKFIYEK